MMTAIDFGLRLKRLRNKAGLSQLELSLRCDDLSASYIGFLEQGRKVPTLTTLNKIARGLGIALGGLLGDDEPDIMYSPEVNRVIAYAMTLTPDECDALIEPSKMIIKTFKK